MVSQTDVDMIQRYVAETSVGPSTVRGYVKNTQKICRALLAGIDLAELSEIEKPRFKSWLNKQTDALHIQLRRQGRRKKGIQTYGIARKVVNIYLHNVFYNCVLNRKYGLENLCDFLEVPIDSHVREWLLLIARNTRPPLTIDPLITRADKIWRIDEKANTAYQDLANQVARQLNTKRVNLDAYFYRGDHSLCIYEEKL